MKTLKYVFLMMVVVAVGIWITQATAATLEGREANGDYIFKDNGSLIICAPITASTSEGDTIICFNKTKQIEIKCMAVPTDQGYIICKELD